MRRDVPNDSTIYKVVVNHEEQYSILPADRPLPRGWREEGKTGLRDECLRYIAEVEREPRLLRRGPGTE